MAIKNRIFKISTLAAVAVIAVTFCFLSENAGDSMDYEETSQIEHKSGAKSSISEEKLTEGKKVVDKYDKEVAKIVDSTPEPTKEVTQASLLGFEPIEGQDIPGIDYKNYINYDNYKFH